MAIEKRGQEPLYLALDLGSNSFHLLLACFRQGKMVRLDRRKEVVRLASGLNEDGSLSAEVRELALTTLSAFSPLLQGLPRSHVRIVGTNTLRAARDSQGFLEEAERALGHPIDIISGIEEARLIYLGVAKDLEPREGLRLVIDIGGGSTELVLGDNSPRQLESLYMGCVSFSQRYFPGGRLDHAAYRRAVWAARREVTGIAGQLGQRPWREAVGSSGTIRAIGAMLEPRGHPLITLPALQSLRDEILTFNAVEDLSVPGLSSDRCAVIAGGMAILEGLFLELDIAELEVSKYAMREGIIHDLAGRFHHRDKRQETLELMMSTYHVDVNQAQRVGQIAVDLARQLQLGKTQVEVLRWAADVHEIGLAISHAGYQKHSAYIVQHADMQGFSRQEQAQLSFLVLNHRRKLQEVDAAYGFFPDWRLVMCLRIACLLHRSRRGQEVMDVAIAIGDRMAFTLILDGQWLLQHPLVAADLQAEVKYWKRLGYDLQLEQRDGAVQESE
jgi:exopolyphosphatase/guanosine-5'-triphosphate,3'-diphosphate pyrophosphatase